MNKEPLIRFKGFTDDWVQCKFGDIAKVRRGLTYRPTDVQSNGVRVLRSSNINEDVLALKCDDVFVTPDCINIDMVQENDILITSANGSSRLVGKHALIKGVHNTVHGGFMLLASTDNPFFINSLMSSSWYSKFINVYVSGGNGAIGNLSKSDLDQQIVFVPNDDEQIKIGQFFKTLDDTIALHQRKLSNLKIYKNSMLSKMFPVNGESVPELRFAGFTDDWVQCKLGEALNDLKSGLSRSLANDDIGLPVIRANNINDGVLNLQEDIKYWYKVDNQGAKTSNYFINKGDILINFINSEKKMGTAAYVENQPARDTIFTTNILRMRVDRRFFDEKFIFSLTFTESYKSYIKSITKQAVNQASFTTVEFKQFDFKVPSVDEQAKIGQFFKTLDDTIALHQRKLSNLKIYKNSMLSKMFPVNGESVPELRFAGFTDDWVQCKLSKLYAKAGSGGTPRSTIKEYYDGDIPFLGISDITKSNGYIHETEKFISELGLMNSAAWIVPIGSICLAMYASVGKVAITSIELSTSQAFYNMVFKQDATRDFVFQYLSKMNINNSWSALVSTGTQDNLNAEKVKSLSIDIPSLKEQAKIGQFFKTLDDTIALHQKKLQDLSMLKKEYLIRLFLS